MTADLRFAWRALWKNPATTLGAVLALALGIGATTTMFGLLDAVALRPLPYPESARLVELWGNVERQTVERRGASVPDYLDWKNQARSFDLMGAWSQNDFIRSGAGVPEQVSGEMVAGDYFSLMGATPLVGRTLMASDDAAGAPATAMISERMWARVFGRDPAIVGRSLQLDDRIYTIVGVAPPGFTGRSDASDVWVSLLGLRSSGPEARGNRWFPALARLAPGVTREAAQADVSAIARQLAQAYPASNDKRGVEVSPLADEVFGQVRPAIGLLFGAVSFVLVIACASVASLLLARTESRRRELSLRRAIGADESRLVRLLLAESAWVVLIGGTAGSLLALWAGDALMALSPVQLPSFAAPAFDWRTFGFVLALGVVITVVIGLSPLGHMRARSLAQDLREGAVETRGGGGRTLQVIVAGQIAVTVTLLVGAALFSRSFAALTRFDPGFEPDGVVSLRVRMPVAGTQPTALANVSGGVETLALLDDLRALPGVTDASVSSSIPLGGSAAIFYSAEGMAPVEDGNRPRTYVHRVSPGYAETIGLRLVEGRSFTVADMAEDSPSVMVTEALAKRFWPNHSALGRRIKQGSAGGPAPWLTIVGVVRDANLRGIPSNPTADPDIFFPYSGRPGAFSVMLRTDSAAAIVDQAVEVLRRRDAGIAVFNVIGLRDLVDEQLAASRFLTWLTGVFAVTALTLAIIGIYGLLAYWVGQRTREIGVRAALGAGRGNLMRLVVGQGLALALVGVTAGGLAAVGLGRFVEAQLYSVQPLDVASFALTAGIMIVTALVASVMPARRALGVDPITALRGE